VTTASASQPEMPADDPAHQDVEASLDSGLQLEKRMAWRNYVYIALYLLLTLSILGLTGRMFWWADYFAHPRLHLAAGLGLLAAIFLLMTDWMRLLAAILGVGLNIFAVFSAIPGDNNTLNAAVMPPGQLRVATVNVGTIIPDSATFEKWVRETHPDILVLVEANAKWLPMLDKLLDVLPYQKIANHTSNYGLTILSRFPYDNLESGVAGPRSLPTMSAEMETPLGRLVLIALHPNPPGAGDDGRARDMYLAQIAAVAQTSSMPTLLVGDFNATPWSSGFEPIRLLPNLQPASTIIPPTWPAALGQLGLPTQHILLSIPYSKPRDLIFNQIQATPAIEGMSHLPLVADLRVNVKQ